MNFPAINDSIPVEDLAKLNESLRKALPDPVGAEARYQTAAGMSAGSLSPLIPQSIENVLASATHTMNEIVLWKNIPKVNVSQNLHEYVVIKDHGFDVDPFIGEGGGSESEFATNASSYERKSVKIKYMAERRQVSDVASLIGLIGDNRQAIAEETERGTLSLMRKVEKQIWHGDEDINSLAFNGIIKQVERTGARNNDGSGADFSKFQYDLEGKAPTPLLLQEILGEIYSAPNYGRPDTIYVEPRIHAELIKQATEHGRHDQFMVQQQSSGLTFGAAQLSIMAPYGAVPVVAAPFLFKSEALPLGGFGAGKPATPAFVAGNDATAAASAKSKFKAADAGVYKYAIVAVNSKGFSESLKSSAVTVAAGDKVSMAVAQDNNVTYYRIYRTAMVAVGQTPDDITFKLIAEVPAAELQAQGGKTFSDFNITRHNCSHIVFAQHDGNIMEFARLLDFIRRPLAEVSAVKPFLLMLFGSPIVKVPSKMFVVRNAGVSTAGGLDPNWKSLTY